MILSLQNIYIPEADQTRRSIDRLTIRSARGSRSTCLQNSKPNQCAMRRSFVSKLRIAACPFPLLDLIEQDPSGSEGSEAEQISHLKRRAAS